MSALGTPARVFAHLKLFELASASLGLRRSRTGRRREVGFVASHWRWCPTRLGTLLIPAIPGTRTRSALPAPGRHHRAGRRHPVSREPVPGFRSVMRRRSRRLFSGGAPPRALFLGPVRRRFVRFHVSTPARLPDPRRGAGHCLLERRAECQHGFAIIMNAEPSGGGRVFSPTWHRQDQPGAMGPARAFRLSRMRHEEVGGLLWHPPVHQERVRCWPPQGTGILNKPDAHGSMTGAGLRRLRLHVEAATSGRKSIRELNSKGRFACVGPWSLAAIHAAWTRPCAWRVRPGGRVARRVIVLNDIHGGSAAPAQAPLNWPT